jgi:hypothetical protein
MPRAQNGFRINNRYLLLTYPQVGPEFDWDRVRRLLHDLGARTRIGRESHQDGGIHYHVFVDFGSPFSTRDCRRFDIGDAHPNIVAVRTTPHRSWQYVGKDGDVVYDDTGREDAGGVAKRSRDDVWADILSASTKDEFFEKGQELAPREFVTSFSSVQLFADWKYRPTREPYRNPRGLDCDISEFPSLEEWLRESIQETTHTGRRYVDLVLGH